MHRILFFGTPDFSLPTLQALHQHEGYEVVAVVTQPDRPRGRGQQRSASPIKEFAQNHAIPVIQPESIKRHRSEFLNDLRMLGEIDCGVVIAFGQILPQEVLDYPKRGCVNIHASLLPRWRGAAPMQHAILAGDSETGVCIMKMEAGLDTGPVFSRTAFSLTNVDTLQTVHDRIARLGAELLLDTLPHILAGALQPVAQSTVGITYANKIETSDSLLNWTAPAKELDRVIRAFCPFPGAYTHFNGKRLKIFSARPCEMHSSASHNPGEIVYCDSSRLEVCCGQQGLLLLEVQLEGKRRMPIAEFLRGNAIAVGMRFG